MKPIIKWPGGKSREIKKIKEKIPKFERYIEPFVGGGALFFDLEPNNAIINDLSKDLISFYKILKDNKKRKNFKKELYKYVNNWDKIKVYLKVFGEEIIQIYNSYKNEKTSYDEFNFKINSLLERKIIPFNGLFEEEFCIDRTNLFNQLKKNLIRKLKQTKERVDKNKNFSNKELKEHIETSFRSGFYMHFRDIMNKINNEKVQISEEKRIANYYFIREFCYGAMFRFNEAGYFNIPYGGIGYNKKDWRKKIDDIFSEDLEKRFKDTKILNLDFRELFKKINLNKNDFIFLDPPYYSKFSEYDQNSFGKLEQKRLAKELLKTKAKFILIIKTNPFILNLYKDKNSKINIDSFNKTYIYNIRGRNSKKTTHLIISNF
jgi:DNA adenine methylase